MNRPVSDKIASLPAMSNKELLTLWNSHFEQPPPPRLRRKLLISVLAYRIQEREHGGLSNSARQNLKQIAKGLRSEKPSQVSVQSNLNGGTRLIRSWKGEVHEVSVQGDGYEYRGRQFGSLSEIAREITGTRWSGPLFFGTKKKAA